MNIFLDFDGTVVEHEYPKIGRCNYGSIEVIKKLQDAGHRIILNTYRIECEGTHFDDALSVLNDDYWMLLRRQTRMDEFEMTPITEWCETKRHPHAWDWETMLSTTDIYIDDIAYGIPLKPACMTTGMMVDWDVLDSQFKEYGIY